MPPSRFGVGSRVLDAGGASVSLLPPAPI